MKFVNRGFLTLSATLALATQIALAESIDNTDIDIDHSAKKQIVNAQLSEGWDSLYMYRGVNELRDGQKYGSSLLWMDLNATFNLTSSDSLKADVWTAFGLGHTSYKETDATLTYTHTFGNLFVSLGYELYALTETSQFQNELQGALGYNISLGPITLTPSVSYFFDIGPDAITDTHGAVPSASSYLLLRLDGSIPVYKDIVTLAPWISYGQNFRYNAKTMSDGSTAFFNGANSWETGIAVPVKLNKYLTVSGYAAYSYNFDGLVGTDPSTFWGGAKVTFSF